MSNVVEPFDALLVISFGGPEGLNDVLPFLENVLRGRNVPRERMLEVAEHYSHFGGVSPINGQNRALIAALQAEFAEHGIKLPIYWGNRNWHPLLPETLAAMKRDGIRSALGFVTSAFSSYSGCRQYRENILDAQAAVGKDAPRVAKLRAFFNHPGYLQPVAEQVATALKNIPANRRDAAELIFTAHSIPQNMADNCRYAAQLQDASEEVARMVRHHRWSIAYQSRSGPPTQPWLEPDIGDAIRQLAAAGTRDVVIMPIGFISDHMEVLFDLDTEVAETCAELGVSMHRVSTVGTHPTFIAMIRQLVQERISSGADRPALGQLGPSHDVCPLDCCPAPAVRPVRP